MVYDAIAGALVVNDEHQLRVLVVDQPFVKE
jgi:hypothetical protein